MQVILFAPRQLRSNEIDILINLFDEGLLLFHLNFPFSSRNKLIEYIKRIPEDYHHRLVIHNYYSLLWRFKLGGIHLYNGFENSSLNVLFLNLLKRTSRPFLISKTCHHIEELEKIKIPVDYIFYGHLFKGFTHRDGQTIENHKKILKSKIHSLYCPAFAYGGINQENIRIVNQLGFYGAALCRSIWATKDPIGVFRQWKHALDNKTPVSLAS